MRPLLSSLFMLFLLAVSGRAGAQTTLLDVQPDQRVRLEITGAGRTIGHLVAVTTDTLVVTEFRTRERLSINLESIRRAEIQQGYHRAAGFWVGALIGLVGGVGLGLLCADVCEDGGLAAVGGLLVGPPIGAILGALSAPPRWRDVPLRPMSGSSMQLRIPALPIVELKLRVRGSEAAGSLRAPAASFSERGFTTAR